MKRKLVVTLGVVMLFGLISSLEIVQEEAAWLVARSSNNSQGYEYYLRSWPHSRHSTEASDRWDELDWHDWCQANVLDGCKAYVNDHPNGKHAAEAAAINKSAQEWDAQYAARQLLQKPQSPGPVTQIDPASDSRLLASLLLKLDALPHIPRIDAETLIIDEGEHGKLVQAVTSRYFSGPIIPIELACLRRQVCEGDEIIHALTHVASYAMNHTYTTVVVNMSWGSDTKDNLLADLFLRLSKAGIVFIAASGNTGQSTCMYPAAYKGVLAVGSVFYRSEGSTNGHYELAPYSDHGSCVYLYAEDDTIRNIEEWTSGELAAKFADIEKDIFSSPATMREEKTNLVNEELPKKLQGLGTSFTSPKVAGILAMILSKNPRLPIDQTIARVAKSACLINGMRVLTTQSDCHGW